MGPLFNVNIDERSVIFKKASLSELIVVPPAFFSAPMSNSIIPKISTKDGALYDLPSFDSNH